jgi:hypothetical protein
LTDDIPLSIIRHIDELYLNISSFGQPYRVFTQLSNYGNKYFEDAIDISCKYESNKPFTVKKLIEV